jgi:hypothetical protein
MDSPPLHTLRLHVLPSQFKIYTKTLLPPTLTSHDDDRGTMTQPGPGSADRNGDRRGLDPATNYLVAKELIAADTLFSVFGGAVIIRENSTQGKELCEHYRHIQNSQTDRKCQYTFQQCSPLIGSGHIPQHSCCTKNTCSTSTNSWLGLILEDSNNDNEDTYLGVGLTTTRAIQPGEQIYVSLYRRQ